VYPGVRSDWEAMSDTGHVPAGLIYTYCILDLPFSGVLDTVLWPFDRWRHCHKAVDKEQTSRIQGPNQGTAPNAGVRGAHRDSDFTGRPRR
jgi:hypothetical protein